MYNIPLSLAVLRGLANVASEGAAKRKAEEVAKSPPITISTKVDPTTGKSLHTIQNISGDALQGGTAEQRVQSAYDEPQAAVAPEIDRLQAVADEHQKRQDEADQMRHQIIDEQLGRLRDLGSQLDSPRGRFTASLRGGNGLIGAAIDAIHASPSLRRQTADERLAVLHRLSPDINEEQQITGQAKARQAGVAAILRATSGDGVPLNEYLQLIQDQSDTELTKTQLAQATRKWTQDTKQADTAKFEGFRKDPAIVLSESFSEVLDRAKASGVAVTPERSQRLELDWEYGRKKLKDVEDRIERERSREERSREAFARRLENATREKPHKISYGEGKDLTVQELGNMLENEAVNKSTVEQALIHKRTQIAARETKLMEEAKVIAAKIKKAEEESESTAVLRIEYSNLKAEGSRIEEEKAALEKLGYAPKAGAVPGSVTNFVTRKK